MKSQLLIISLLILALYAGIASALTLDQALNLGRERSLSLEGPRIDRQRINGQITEAWSNALPQVEVTAAVQHYWKPSVVFFPNPETGEIIPLRLQQDNNSMAEATLSQPLFTFGRVGAGLKAAYAARRSNDHLINNTDRSLELEVTRRFWAVLLLRDVLEARAGSLAISDSSLRRVQRMRDVGLMSDYDVLRVQVQASNQIPQFQQAQNSLRLTELSLKELLGVPVDTEFTVEGSLADFTLAVGNDSSLTRLSSRDDLEALRDLTEVYRNIYVINRNSRWPVLSGQVKYAWQWSSDDWAINPHNNASSVYGGVALNIPIWTSGSVSGKTQQARADWRKSQLDLDQAQRGARLQYESFLSTYQTAASSETAAVLAVSQAQTARTIAQTKLSQGQITPLEMDAARLEELVARVALAQARYDRLVAAAQTRMALGLMPYSN